MFKKLKLAPKLILGFIIVALIAATIGFIGIRSLNQIDEADTRLYEKNTLAILYASHIEADHHELLQLLRDIIIEKDSNKMIKIEEEINKLLESSKKYTEKLKDTQVDEADRRLYAEFLEARKKFLPYIMQVIAFAKQNKKKEALEILYGKAQIAADAEASALDKIILDNEESAKNTAAENTKLSNRVTTIMIIVTIFGFIVATLLGIFIARSISRPLISGVGFADSIAEKDLTKALDTKIINRGDEIGVLAKALDRMYISLVSIVSNMTDIANHLAASSEEIASTSQNLAEGATRQSASIEETAAAARNLSDSAQNQAAGLEETSAAVEELTSAIAQVSLNTDNVNKKAIDLLQTAKESSLLVENAIKSMEKINDSSQMISEILGVINDIADQTNLLALNAAIEAARAGEHGRGFAVVADEIAKLSDKSSENAKEIEKLIKVSIKDVTNGSQIVQKAGEAFKVIISGVDNNTILMNEIAKAVDQQKQSAEQLQKAIEEINTITQANSASAEEMSATLVEISEITQNTSASSEEMSASTTELHSQAENIKETFDEFKLSEDNVNRIALKTSGKSIGTVESSNKSVTVFPENINK